MIPSQGLAEQRNLERGITPSTLLRSANSLREFAELRSASPPETRSEVGWNEEPEREMVQKRIHDYRGASSLENLNGHLLGVVPADVYEQCLGEGGGPCVDAALAGECKEQVDACKEQE